MERSYKKSTLYTSLLVAFIDFFGVGLVYPLFSSMLFDADYPLMPMQTSHFMRGLWLSILITCMPLMQFFFSPMWGALSDNWGRRRPLQMSLALALIGYGMAVIGVWMTHIFLLLLSRLIIGMASGNTSIVQATIADMSSSASKARYFGLYTMALGLGFALGPFLGGLLSVYGYSTPFLFASAITLINLFFSLFFFEETHLKKSSHRSLEKIHLAMSISQLKKAFQMPALKAILLASFLYNFGWSYFFEFAPVYLIERFGFSSVELGLFYGVAGGFYGLSTGFLINPVIRRFSSNTLFFAGIISAAFAVLILPFIPTVGWLWPMVFFLTFFVSFVTPTSIALVSEIASVDHQGQALGNLNAMNSAAFVLSPLLSGYLVGLYPTFPMWLGGSVMLIAAFMAYRNWRIKATIPSNRVQ